MRADLEEVFKLLARAQRNNVRVAPADRKRARELEEKLLGNVESIEEARKHVQASKNRSTNRDYLEAWACASQAEKLLSEVFDPKPAQDDLGAVTQQTEVRSVKP